MGVYTAMRLHKVGFFSESQTSNRPQQLLSRHPDSSLLPWWRDPFSFLHPEHIYPSVPRFVTHSTLLKSSLFSIRVVVIRLESDDEN